MPTIDLLRTYLLVKSAFPCKISPTSRTMPTWGPPVATQSASSVTLGSAPMSVGSAWVPMSTICQKPWGFDIMLGCNFVFKYINFPMHNQCGTNGHAWERIFLKVIVWNFDGFNASFNFLPQRWGCHWHYLWFLCLLELLCHHVRAQFWVAFAICWEFSAEHCPQNHVEEGRMASTNGNLLEFICLICCKHQSRATRRREDEHFLRVLHFEFYILLEFIMSENFMHCLNSNHMKGGLLARVLLQNFTFIHAFLTTHRDNC